ncbi:HAD family hydrolase [Kitasatospora sp. NPDC004289]
MDGLPGREDALTPAARRAAFLDVDGTLIRITSLFRFLAFDLRLSGAPPSRYEELLAEVRSLKAAGAPRERTNRAFYRVFAGRPAEELAQRGELWFREEESLPGLFNPRVLERLEEHRAAGAAIVAVSGSFPPCLAPIARRIGADAVICTRPEVRDGRYSGEVPVPMIGDQKARAVHRFASVHGLDLAECHAYGDDESDAPLLAAVGHPCAVGDRPALLRLAAARGWPVLDG